MGGKDNYSEDRQVAECLLAVMPDARAAARANRRFLVRAVRHLAAEAGIGQFIDIGTGFRQPAMSIRWRMSWSRGRGWYMPITTRWWSRTRGRCCAGVLGWSRSRGMCGTRRGILDHRDVRAVVDLGEPVAVVLSAVLPFVPDEDSPYKLVEMLKAAVAPGSYLVMSHATGKDIGPEAARQMQELYARTTAPIVLRSRADIARPRQCRRLARRRRWPSPAGRSSLAGSGEDH